MTILEKYKQLLDELTKEFSSLTDKRGEWMGDYSLWVTEYEAWSPSDMLYIVDNFKKLVDTYGDWNDTEDERRDMLLADIERWIDYNVSVAEFGIQYINLKSWLMGCPRMSDEQINKLRSLKMDLNSEVEKCKEEFGAQNNSSQPEHLAKIYEP